MKLARTILKVVAFVLLCFAATAQAQVPVRVLVGFAPGGQLDAVARLSAEKLAEGIGRPVVVENRTGATGQIAAMALKASIPDGNTLMAVPAAVLTLTPHTLKSAPPYDTLRDFVPIAHIGGFDYALAVAASFPAKDFGEWLNRVRADGKNAAYGSAGAGTTMHFMGIILAQETGLPLVHVSYRGVAPALAELVGGQLPTVIITLGSVLPQARAGKVRILAHSGGQRSSLAPEVPTFKELGYPSLEASGWHLLVAPAGMRPEVVARYHDIIARAQRTKAVRDRMLKFELESREMTPAEVAATIKAEYQRWGPVVKASGLGAGK